MHVEKFGSNKYKVMIFPEINKMLITVHPPLGFCYILSACSLQYIS